jgi:AcrR family transcriptional regulator
MIASTALLVREQGARATSIDDVLAHSGAPRGSVYHHFPGGRSQLLREATDYAGEFVAGRIDRASGSLEVLDSLIGDYRELLVASGFRAGCPVVAVAVEAGDPESDLHRSAADAFARWEAVLAKRLSDDGVGAARSDELATMSIAAIEGAIVMARARRDPGPLDSVHRQLRALLRAELERGSPE